MRDTFRTRLQNAVQCWIGLHHIPPTSAVETMGAVFAGGMCIRCYKVKVGPFICNCWDESQTETKDDVVHLKGINPILSSGQYFVMDLEGLEKVATEKRANLKDSSKKTEEA